MAIEIHQDSGLCYRCGQQFGKTKGNFQACSSEMYKGGGFLPFCKTCVDAMYNSCLAKCGDEKDAVRHMCRKLDLYWDEKVYNRSDSGKAVCLTPIAKYISKLNGSSSHIGKSYDTTLSNEGALWIFSKDGGFKEEDTEEVEEIEETESDLPEPTDEMLEFWGLGYDKEMYFSLEQRRIYWMKKMGVTELDIGAEAILRQICALELDINRDRAAGRPTDKATNVLNSLLGSANLKPAQQKNEDSSKLDTTPFGVWIRRWESMRPIPEPDPAFKDVDGIVRYILTWFYGHLSKMLGIKNANATLYNAEIDRLRVERPEFDGDDDDILLGDVFAPNGDDDEDDHIQDDEFDIDWNLDGDSS